MIQNLIFGILFLITMFLYLLPRSTEHHQSCILIFTISSRKSQSQQNLAKKITHFTIQFRSKNLTHFTNLNSIDIENNMLLQHSQKPFWLYKFFSNYVAVWCQKKHLHCSPSWRPKTAFLKYFQSKCLHISAYLRKKIFVPRR